jgi:hypothetical protein
VTGDLDLYRHQHRELLGVAQRLGARADHASLSTAPGAEEVRGLLATLSGKLMVHLQMEDRSLYPALLGSPDPEVRGGVARFQAEMGSLRQRAGLFFGRWLRTAAIEREPDAFSAELRPLLHALAGRIAAEDAELYPLAERLDVHRP